jgi:hypothetical protein
MTHALDTAKAIGWALYHAHQKGETPAGIVVDPPTRDWMRDHEIGDWWSLQPTLFDLPVQVDARGSGWRVWMR